MKFDLRVKLIYTLTSPFRDIFLALQTNSMRAITNPQNVPVSTSTKTPPTFLSSSALVEGVFVLSQNLSMFFCFHHLSYIAWMAPSSWRCKMALESLSR